MEIQRNSVFNTPIALGLLAASFALSIFSSSLQAADRDEVLDEDGAPAAPKLSPQQKQALKSRYFFKYTESKGLKFYRITEVGQRIPAGLLVHVHKYEQTGIGASTYESIMKVKFQDEKMLWRFPSTRDSMMLSKTTCEVMGYTFDVPEEKFLLFVSHSKCQRDREYSYFVRAEKGVLHSSDMMFTWRYRDRVKIDSNDHYWKLPNGVILHFEIYYHNTEQHRSWVRRRREEFKNGFIQQNRRTVNHILELGEWRPSGSSHFPKCFRDAIRVLAMLAKAKTSSEASSS